MLTHLVYISSARRLFTTEELRDLLAVSRRNNAREDVTGMMLYRGGSFMQVLEGPQDAVLDLYQRI